MYNCNLFIESHFVEKGGQEVFEMWRERQVCIQLEDINK